MVKICTNQINSNSTVISEKKFQSKYNISDHKYHVHTADFERALLDKNGFKQLDTNGNRTNPIEDRVGTDDTGKHL